MVHFNSKVPDIEVKFHFFGSNVQDFRSQADGPHQIPDDGHAAAAVRVLTHLPPPSPSLLPPLLPQGAPEGSRDLCPPAAPCPGPPEQQPPGTILHAPPRAACSPASSPEETGRGSQWRAEDGSTHLCLRRPRPSSISSVSELYCLGVTYYVTRSFPSIPKMHVKTYTYL